MRLSYHDHRRVNEAIAVLYRMAITRGALQAIATMLPRTVGGALSCVSVSRPQGFGGYALSHQVDWPDPMENYHLLDQHPRIAQKQGTIVKISDVVSRETWHRQDLYHLVKPYSPFEDDLGVDLPLDNGGILKACVMRESRSFREEDREIFSLMLPHFVSLLCPPVQQPRTLTSLGLTRREQEVLHWVTEGKTNSEISTILDIARGTVKIHLERIYEKLGVVNRHGAARRALEVMHPERF